MPETTPLIKAALNLRGGAGFDVYFFPGSVNAMAFSHGYTAINHHLVGIMNDSADDCFANSGITFISNAVVPAFWFKLCTENHRAFYTTGFNDLKKFPCLFCRYWA